MYQKKQTLFNLTKPFQFFLIAIGLVLLFPLIKYIKKQILLFNLQDEEIKEDKNYALVQNPVIAVNIANKITTNKLLQACSKKLAHDLGTSYSDKNSWYSFIDPRGWSENDKAVADAVIFHRNSYHLLKKLYFSVYSNSRDLSQDILQLVDNKELKRIQKYLSLS